MFSIFLFFLIYSTRVSKELRAGHSKAPRLAVCVVLVLAIIEDLFLASVLILICNVWSYAYSKETEVVKYVSKLMPILAALNFIDGLQSVLSFFFLLLCHGS